jgi:hypothetical protein
VWVDSNEPPDFVFVVKQCECGAGKTTLAQALLGDPHTSVYASIYFDHVLSATHKTDLSPGDLLGGAVAHELGHLLGLRHVREGLMMPNWSGQQLAFMARRGLCFNQAETLQMQTEIRIRRMLEHDKSDLLALAAHNLSRQQLLSDHARPGNNDPRQSNLWILTGKSR